MSGINYNIDNNKKGSRIKDLDNFILNRSKRNKKINHFFITVQKYIKILISVVICACIMFTSMFVALLYNAVSNSYIDTGTGDLMTKLNYESFLLEYTIISTIAFFIFAFICCKISFPMAKKELNIKSNKLFVDIRYILTFIFIAILLQFMTAIEQFYMPNSLNISENLTYKTVILTAITSLVVPVYEEIIYRYIIYGYALRATKNKTASNIIQAVIFALFHMDIYLLFIYFTGGYLLGEIRQKHGIKSSIVYHTLINIVSIVPFTMFITNIYIQIGLSIAVVAVIIYILAKQINLFTSSNSNKTSK